MSEEDGSVLMKGYLLASGNDIGYRMGFKRYFFVLKQHLYYYETDESYTANCEPLDVIPLDEYYVSSKEGINQFQFAVYGYPKSVELIAPSISDGKEWIIAFAKLSKKDNLPLLGKQEK